MKKITWTIKDVFFIFLYFHLFAALITVVLFKYIEENAYIGSFFLSVFLIVYVGIFLKKKKETWRSLGLYKKDSFKFILKGFLIGILFYLFTKLIFYPDDVKTFINRFDFTKLLSAVFFLPITFKGFNGIIFTPFIEEILHRGLLFQALMNRFSKLNSIVITTVIFALLHFSTTLYLKPKAIIIIYGLCLTYLFARKKNLLICISCHSTINYLVWIANIIENN